MVLVKINLDQYHNYLTNVSFLSHTTRNHQDYDLLMYYNPFCSFRNDFVTLVALPILFWFYVSTTVFNLEF